jgi:hypothetical protein
MKFKIIKLLEGLGILIRSKHSIIELKDNHFLIIFRGTFGGVSFLTSKYYINITNIIFISNIRKSLCNYNINYDDFYYKNIDNNIIPLAIIESLIYEDKKIKEFKVSNAYDIKSNNIVMVNKTKNSTTNTIICENLGGFFHFYMEILPIIINNHEAPSNLFFSIGEENFYQEILAFYNVDYSNNFNIDLYDTLENTFIPLPKYYPSRESILTMYKVNQKQYIENKKLSYKIYITRKNERARRISNEYTLIQMLKKYGFIVIDPGELSYREQVSLFTYADVIVAPHGAALTNIVWCKKNVQIIELNSDIDIRWHFAKISFELQFKYKLILGRKVDDKYFHINENLVEQILINSNIIKVTNE